MDIKGMGAVVTGGASGLGGASAAHLAALGARVTIFDLNEELGAAHAKAIGGQCVRVNVTDEAEVEGIDSDQHGEGAYDLHTSLSGGGSSLLATKTEA